MEVSSSGTASSDGFTPTSLNSNGFGKNPNTKDQGPNRRNDAPGFTRPAAQLPSQSYRPWWHLPDRSTNEGSASNAQVKQGRREFASNSGKFAGDAPGAKGERPFYLSSGNAYLPATSSSSSGIQIVDDRLGKIVGGNEMSYGSFPWQAEIEGFSATQRRWKHHCGGALISQWHVLTAAHCIRARPKEYLLVKLGEHRLDSSDSHEETYKVASMVHHTNHRANGPYSDDIGVLKLDREVEFNGFIKPICLPQSDDQYVPGTVCTVTGWGLQNDKDSTSLSKTLLGAKVPVISSEICKQDAVYGKRSQKILEGMMCAGYLDGGIDACGGDSGGPLSCKINGRYVLLGLVSWGDGCARRDRPGVYVKVSHYLDWIMKSVDSL
ncbi:unnamed protein product [Notodromas monacha]|uniref:Peptidase S1 domain-containing protein n=1 Tax=Notodromas monacha TaxID=399045 RepID=A0A7R9BUT5_9CRUS|nr:unnamed protein product [Notodromas monacha]CAG0921184.1 unnamed protein product [Notodromas monacha]